MGLKHLLLRSKDDNAWLSLTETRLCHISLPVKETLFSPFGLNRQGFND